jgi:hypothetical protein
MDLNLYIITIRKSSGEVSSYFSALTQRHFKSLRAARTDVRELFTRKLALERAGRGEGYFKVSR